MDGEGIWTCHLDEDWRADPSMLLFPAMQTSAYHGVHLGDSDSLVKEEQFTSMTLLEMSTELPLLQLFL